jgi:hypothetical protein
LEKVDGGGERKGLRMRRREERLERGGWRGQEWAVENGGEGERRGGG